ncbi:hypothetical protein BDK51DRAFT_38342 [Blyttiomyces helicus]|uniref:F-box domain-containing protein n=1 Tax=Blyttiomyces helicus TaxID=388810 RepID=A0A4P9WEW0_9FUNG|nr:hypothetical protein BDK51DRAFT_38342 [Blyttiomyces helicus]|eukprot:RKO90345.1 hypothetical protein BDK51DRAFT_38342 [Blyttiomyces helicus]
MYSCSLVCKGWEHTASRVLREAVQFRDAETLRQFSLASCVASARGLQGCEAAVRVRCMGIALNLNQGAEAVIGSLAPRLSNLLVFYLSLKDSISITALAAFLVPSRPLRILAFVGDLTEIRNGSPLAQEAVNGIMAGISHLVELRLHSYRNPRSRQHLLAMSGSADLSSMTEFDDDFLKTLLTFNPLINELKVTSNRTLTDKTFDLLVSHFPLSLLVLRKMPELTESGAVRYLASTASAALHTLNISSNAWVTESVVASIGAHVRNLEFLNVADCTSVSFALATNYVAPVSLENLSFVFMLKLFLARLRRVGVDVDTSVRLTADLRERLMAAGVKIVVETGTTTRLDLPQ